MLFLRILDHPTILTHLFESWFIDVIHQQEFHRHFLRLQPQPQLFLKRRREGWAETFNRGSREVLRLPEQFKIVVAGEPRPIDNGTRPESRNLFGEGLC